MNITFCRRLYYTLNSGKNSKLKYYITSYLWVLTPHWLLSLLRKLLLANVQQRSDWNEIKARVDYYNRLCSSKINHSVFQQKAISLAQQQKTSQSVYYLDSFRYAKSFPLNNKWCLYPGDVTTVPSVPSIVKSRPIAGDNANSVLLKLDRVRHFLFVNDRISYADKLNKVVFRGLIGQFDSHNLKQNRYDFVQKFFGNPLFNIGVIDKNIPQWHTTKMTINEHLAYKFIMALEGNDVASNLKWIMSSNSIAVMPRPKYETWFMEGTLIPDYHYIEVAPDYSDLEAKIDYYIQHPHEAEAIIAHAHAHVARFRNARREYIVSQLVLSKYFETTEVKN
ncbi:glycosyl transferase family 90 [Prevotella pallens]|uniref:Lipopolysaccharide core biosynthesis protein LpsA n=2 Tax=Prevotella pallens TaxID=60133 RepID=F9DLJ6_9BACT|nr:glycosyl transferase family 90 [Prevotella pallens]EGQ12774.1 lipopolysaccharide core biosynthesis protein LpsA [Prevotella pallens ATCC 700821]MBF1479944.1 glycosyltransferase [Prevotella pallens]RAS48681.1 glycosyl transferase family 90 [Prevotella pallens]